MLDLDDIREINIRMTPNGRTGGVDPITDARARANAITGGNRWECRRVKAWVTLDDCLSRASAQGGYTPCRECATIAPYLKQETIMAKRKTPQQNISPIIDDADTACPEIQGDQQPCGLHAGAPTVETQDAHGLYGRPAGRPNDAPLQTTAPVAATDPLAGLALYKPLPRVLNAVTDQPYMHISKAALSFSGRAVHDYRIHSHETMSVFFEGQPGAITRLVVQLGGPMMRITHPKSNYSGRKVSAWGLVRHLGLEPLAGKRYALKELAPGYLEVDLHTIIDLPEDMRPARKASKEAAA